MIAITKLLSTNLDLVFKNDGIENKDKDYGKIIRATLPALALVFLWPYDSVGYVSALMARR